MFQQSFPENSLSKILLVAKTALLRIHLKLKVKLLFSTNITQMIFSAFS